MIRLKSIRLFTFSILSAAALLTGMPACSSDSGDGPGGENKGDNSSPYHSLPAENRNMPCGGTVVAQYSDAPEACSIAKLVDGDAGTKYCTRHNSFSITWNGNSNVAVLSYSLTSADDAPEMDPKAWTLEGSTDSKTWKTIDSRSDQTFGSRKEKKEYEVENNVTYRYYRLNVKQNAGSESTQIAEWTLSAAASTGENIDDGWKLSYEGVDFYLQFDENGNVITNTNEKILRPELEAQYHLDFKGEQTVLLTLAGNTSLQYLKNNQESTFLISSYASDLIAATGQAHGLTMNLSPVTTADLAANRETKAAILHRVEALENISCGAIREKGGDILAYYTLSSDNDNNWSMQLTDIADGKVVHTNHALVLNVEDDRLGVVTAPGLDIKGHALKSITYDYDGATQPVIGNASLVFDFNAGASWTDAYMGNWNTHIIDAKASSLDLSLMPESQLEMDNRSPRNLVICPGSISDEDAGKWHYVFFELNAAANNGNSCVLFRNTAITTPFGGYGNDVNLAKEQFKPLIDLLFCESGLWVWEKDGNTYFIQPAGNGWFKFQ